MTVPLGCIVYSDVFSIRCRQIWKLSSTRSRPFLAITRPFPLEAFCCSSCFFVILILVLPTSGVWTQMNFFLLGVPPIFVPALYSAHSWGPASLFFGLPYRLLKFLINLRKHAASIFGVLCKRELSFHSLSFLSEGCPSGLKLSPLDHCDNIQQLLQ